MTSTPSVSKSSWSIWSRIIPQNSKNDELFKEQFAQTAAMVDRAFSVVLLLEWIVGLALALIVSPYAWVGTTTTFHIHVWAALLLGGVIALPPAALAWFRPGRTETRHVVGAAQALMAALYIHLTGGRIETHFMVFGSLAFLAAYRDWRVLITASLVVLADHLLRGWLYPRSVYGVESAPIWRSIEHAWWVIFEDIFLVVMILRGNKVQQSVAKEKMGEMGQYTLKEKLGGGGMGEVFLAEHRLLKRICAIKLIKPAMANDAAMMARFEREVQTTAKLRHPNTVEIYDYGHLEDGTFFYVMEYLPGLSLQRLIDQHGRMPAGRVVHLLRQICGALHEAHEIGMVHRDIKPDNVFVCRLGGQHDVTKLFDFGLVRPFVTDGLDSQLTQAGTILGTPYFMAPEQVTGDAIDQRSDLYSLAAVGYYLLTGKRPFDGKNPLAIMCARIKDPIQPPSVYCPGLPEDLESIILQCLSVKPEDRFPNVKALQNKLAGLQCAVDWDEDTAKLWWDDSAVDTQVFSNSNQPTEILKLDTALGIKNA